MTYLGDVYSLCPVSQSVSFLKTDATFALLSRSPHCACHTAGTQQTAADETESQTGTKLSGVEARSCFSLTPTSARAQFWALELEPGPACSAGGGI